MNMETKKKICPKCGQEDGSECFRDIMPDNAKWNNSKQCTKPYSITHGDVLLDRIGKEGNIFLKVLPSDKNLTLKPDECGRLHEKGSRVLFPALFGMREGFDPYLTAMGSPLEAGMVGCNEHLNEFGIISDDGSFMTNADGNRISPIDRLAAEAEIDIRNQENHKKHRHYSFPRKKYVCHFQPFDKVLARNNKESAWPAAFFSHINPRDQECICTIEGGLNKRYCIPCNEETAHLAGEKAITKEMRLRKLSKNASSPKENRINSFRYFW